MIEAQQLGAKTRADSFGVAEQTFSHTVAESATFGAMYLRQMETVILENRGEGISRRALLRNDALLSRAMSGGASR